MLAKTKKNDCTWSVYYVYENLTHHFLTCYAYCNSVKAYRELNLERALDEDTGVFSFLSFFFSTGPDCSVCLEYLDGCNILFWGVGSSVYILNNIYNSHQYLMDNSTIV